MKKTTVSSYKEISTVSKSLSSVTGWALAIIAAGTITSCSISRPVIPEKITPPPTFRANDTTVNTGTDTATIAKIKWSEYFSDPKLSKLIDEAIRQNPDLQVAFLRVQKSNAALMVARNALLPNVNGHAAASIDKFGDYTMTGVGNFDTNLSQNIDEKQRVTQPFVPDYFLGLRSTWEVDLWGKLRNQKKAAAARYMKEQNSARFLQTMLVAEVAGLYYNLAALDNELSIIRRNIGLQANALEIVKIQKEAGLATELAVQQFNAQLLFTKASEFRVKQEQIATENELNNFLGRFPQSISRDSLKPMTDYRQAIASGLPSDLLSRRPDIREAEMELVAAKADVNAARAAFYPTLSINPAIGLNAFNASVFFSGASLAYGVFGGLTAPLFNQKRIKAAYQISIADNQQAYQQYRETVIEAYSEVVTRLNAIENLNRAHTLKDQEVDALKSAVTNSRELYVAGRASYLEIISAQKVLLEAELELNRIQKDQYVTRVNLYRALGGGWE